MNRSRSLIFLLILISACNHKSSQPSPAKEEQEEISDYPSSTTVGEIDLPGNYGGILRPLNAPTSGHIPTGKVEFSITEKEFKALTFLDDDTEVVHLQSLHEGSRCPTLLDDENGDGLIDMKEAEKVVGKVLIPLDNDLSAQLLGMEKYPIGKSFSYSKTTSLKELLNDLRKMDEEPRDNIMKLTPEENLNLIGRVVLIHGTKDSSRVPATVRPHRGLPNYLS